MRTINDVSRHFLSDADPVVSPKHTPVVGCYLTKSVLNDEVFLGELVRSTSPKGSRACVCYLGQSLTSIRATSAFDVIPIPIDFLDESLIKSGSEAARSSVSVSTRSIYYFLFREDDCGVLDAVFSLLAPILLVTDASRRDMSEVFKLVKGFLGSGSDRTWFLRLYPDLDIRKSRLICDELNKVLGHFFRFSMNLWVPGRQDQDAWNRALEGVRPEIVCRQDAWVKCVEERMKHREGFS